MRACQKRGGSVKRFELWRFGLQNVLSSTLRSVLTVLGMAIGVAAILAVITLGDAGELQVQQEIGRLGIDRVRITASGDPLTRHESELLRTELNTPVDELIYVPGTARIRSKTVNTILIGCSRSYLSSMAPVLSGGRELTDAEWRGQGKAALVGAAVAETLQLKTGEWFSFNGSMLLCVGIIDDIDNASGMDLRQSVTVAFGMLAPRLGGKVHELSVHLPAGSTPDDTATRAGELLRAAGIKDATIVSMQLQAEAASSVVAVFVDVLGWIAVICMLVGGIGVMNVLLVSVRERRREIGVLQSLGASGAQICSLFLCESVIYALTGGILGLLLGGVIIATAGFAIGLSPTVRAGDCTLVFLSAVAVGLLAGVVPAAQACRLRPVDALRDD